MALALASHPQRLPTTGPLIESRTPGIPERVARATPTWWLECGSTSSDWSLVAIGVGLVGEGAACRTTGVDGGCKSIEGAWRREREREIMTRQALGSSGPAWSVCPLCRPAEKVSFAPSAGFIPEFFSFKWDVRVEGMLMFRGYPRRSLF